MQYFHIIYFLLVGLITCQTIQYVVPSTTTHGRYESIRVPTRQALKRPGDNFGYYQYATPARALSPPDAGLDVCKETDYYLKTLLPHVWNNSLVSNPCELYFCSVEQAVLPTPFDNDTRFNGDQRTYSVDRVATYCTLCQHTVSQNFTGTLATRNCTWYNPGCDCPSDTLCVGLFQFPVCYSWGLNMFYKTYDVNHIVLIWLYTTGEKILSIIGFIIMFFFAMVFLVIPEVLRSIRVVSNVSRSAWQRVKALFSIRLQIVGLLLVVDVLFPIFALYDLIDFQNLYEGMMFCSAVFMFYIFSLLTVLWLHIYESAQKFQVDLAATTLSPRLIVTLIVMLVTTLSGGVAGVVLASLDTFVPEARAWKGWPYLFGSITLVLFVFFALYSIVMTIASIIVLKYFFKQSSSEGIFGQRLTYFVGAINLEIALLNVLILYFALTIMIKDDFISYAMYNIAHFSISAHLFVIFVTLHFAMLKLDDVIEWIKFRTLKTPTKTINN